MTTPLFRAPYPGEIRQAAIDAWHRNLDARRAKRFQYPCMTCTCGTCRQEIKHIEGCRCIMDEFIAEYMRTHPPVNMAFVEAIVDAMIVEGQIAMGPEQRAAMVNRMYKIAQDAADASNI